MRLLSILLLATSALLLPACGGGGGGGSSTTPPPPAFNDASVVGDYMFVMVQGNVPRTLISNYLRASSNGAGTLSLSGGSNSDGVVAPVPSTGLTYNVAPDGTMSLFSGATPVAQGGLSADGKRAVLAITAGIDPGMILMIRIEGSYGPTSLSGNYVAGEMRMRLGMPHVFAASLLTDTFDGQGAYNGLGFSNDEGTVIQYTLMGPASSYAVAPNGQVTLSPTFGQPLEGQLAAGGDYALLGGTTQSPNLDGAPAVRLMIKEGTGFSAASVEGSYWAASIEFNTGGPALEVFTGTMDATATGTATLAGQVNSGSGGVPGSATASVTISPSGRLTMNRGGSNETLRGQLSPDRQIGFVTGGEMANSNPVLMVFIRK